MKTAYRTHTCGALRATDDGSEVTICGWVDSLRDQGGVLFINLRDRYGVTQATFRGDQDAELLKAGERARLEWVLQVSGRVAKRPPEALNPRMPTGEIEVEATALTVLSEADTPPFPVDDRTEVNTDLRLRHRYLDLRRAEATHYLAARARIAATFRQHLEGQGFVEIETPTLIRSTPEGARDYIVPSRVHGGSFYALPQSPQLFKQLLMIGGQDRYYQLARCYRDEDLRADRQPEFSQVDIEASFVEQEDVFEILEPPMVELIETWRNEKVERPFLKMTYAEAMDRFGSDKPDLRNPLELRDVGAVADAIGFPPFSAALEAGGLVKVLVAPGGAQLSRKQIEGFEKEARSMGAPGLAWAKVTEEQPTGPLARFLKASEEAGAAFLAATGAEAGDWFCCAAGDAAVVHRVLGGLRDSVARRLDLVDLDANSVLWVTDFPLVEWNADEDRFDAMHHPFTSPTAEDTPVLLEEAATPGSVPPGRIAGVCAEAYDLVLNGAEVAGGSIRIHRRDVQQAVFSLLGISPEQVERRFGWFVEALRYGTPPHGGIAVGFDRLVMMLLAEESMQNVIAFPKTLQAADLVCQAPAPVDEAQLEECRIRLLPTEGTEPASST